MEIETAARRLLLSLPSVNGYVAGSVYKFSLEEHVDGTGGMAAVVRRSNGWTNPDPVKSLEFPILMIDCWADDDRVDGEVVRENSTDKAFSLYRTIDKALHGMRDVWWGQSGDDPGLRVITCVRGVEPFFATGSDVHSSGGGANTPTGNTTVVTVQYDLTVAH